MSDVKDPFVKHRAVQKTVKSTFQGEAVPMILGHEDVRAAAKDWKTFSSDAPFRVPIPSEEDVRSIRQLPIEVNPPEHGEYRALVEPLFRKPKDPTMIAQVQGLIGSMVEDALSRPAIEVVREFALPLQSRALTYLLGMPESEADVWIGWGTHVFRDGGQGQKKGAALEAYLNQQFDRAERSPGTDFFSILAQATYRGRKLTRAEMLGFGNLTFAGGRDTIIQSVASAMGYFGGRPQALEYLRADPSRIVLACEEFFRAFTPLTHIGRVCPVETNVHGDTVPPKGRVSLCWASANMDERVFDKPQEVKLDRKPNPHVAFGFGEHLCLGAAHARLIMRTLVEVLCAKVETVSVVSATPHVEREEQYERTVGYDALTVKLTRRG
jgi:cytochrome P450